MSDYCFECSKNFVCISYSHSHTRIHWSTESSTAKRIASCTSATMVARPQLERPNASGLLPSTRYSSPAEEKARQMSRMTTTLRMAKSAHENAYYSIYPRFWCSPDERARKSTKWEKVIERKANEWNGDRRIADKISNRGYTHSQLKLCAYLIRILCIFCAIPQHFGDSQYVLA